MLPVTMARCSPDGVAIRYVGLLPVLWTTSLFDIKGPINMGVNNRGTQGNEPSPEFEVMQSVPINFVMF